MPHKKNPITGEKLSGLARILRGNAMVALENVALWHERDISHSSAERIILPDSTIALDHMLTNLEKLVRNLVVYPDNMMRNLELTHGLIHSQQLLLLLTDKGISREKAYRLVQRNAMACWESGEELQVLVRKDKELMKLVSEKDLASVFDLERHFSDVDRTFREVGL